MNKPAYFKQFGAEDYNIFANGNKSYVMSRFIDDPEGVYYMLFEHVEGQTGVSYYLFCFGEKAASSSVSRMNRPACCCSSM